MKYNTILRPSFKMCLFGFRAAQISWTGMLEGKKYHVSESTSSNKNAIANSAGPVENIHKEQSGQGQHC